MPRIDKAMQCILDAEEQYRGHNYDIYPDDLRQWLQALADAGLLAPAPQIIRTVEELEALDPDTLVLDSAGYTVRYGSNLSKWDLPLALIREGAEVRACREALEGETT